jgi:hypothetical protein
LAPGDQARALGIQFSEALMEQQAAVNSPAKTAGADSSQTRHHEGRGAWVLTAYGISGLALFGVLIYYFSVYVTH